MCAILFHFFKFCFNLSLTLSLLLFVNRIISYEFKWFSSSIFFLSTSLTLFPFHLYCVFIFNIISCVSRYHFGWCAVCCLRVSPPAAAEWRRRLAIAEEARASFKHWALNTYTHTHISIRLMPVHWMSESVVVWVKKFPLPDTKWKEKGINYRLNITAAMGIHNRSNLLQQQHTRLSFANLECLQVKAGYIGESLTHKLRETYNAASWSMSSFFFSLLLIRARRLFFIITSLERWAVSISNACYGWKCLSWLVSWFDFDRDA